MNISMRAVMVTFVVLEVNIVHSAVGLISQSDIDLAASCRALIVGFTVGLMGFAIATSARLAGARGVAEGELWAVAEVCM